MFIVKLAIVAGSVLLWGNVARAGLIGLSLESIGQYACGELSPVESMSMSPSGIPGRIVRAGDEQFAGVKVVGLPASGAGAPPPQPGGGPHLPCVLLTPGILENAVLVQWVLCTSKLILPLQISNRPFRPPRVVC
jgi:hypothetical protein